MPVIASRGAASASGFGAAAPYHQPALILGSLGNTWGFRAYRWDDVNGVGEQYADPPGTFAPASTSFVRLVNVVGTDLVQVPATAAGGYNTYQWNGQRGGFVKKYAEPASYTNFAHLQAWNGDRTRVATGTSSSPYFGLYEWSDAGYGAKLAYTGTVQNSPGNGFDLVTSPDGTVWAQMGNSSSSSLTAYPFATAASGGRLGSNSPPSGASAGTTSISFSPAGDYIVYTHGQNNSPSSGPFLTIYPFSNDSGFGTGFYPSSSPNGTGAGAFNNEGTHFLMAGSRAVTGRIGYITVYTWDGGGSMTRMAEPPSGTTQVGSNSVGAKPSWNKKGTMVAVSQASVAPFYAVYEWSNTTGLGVKRSVPDLGATTALSVKFI